MEKTYTYKELIDIYIKIRQLGDINTDFRQYYSGLVSALEQLFDVRINLGSDSQVTDVRFWSLAILFDDIIKRLRWPGVGTGFMEGGPGISFYELSRENPVLQPAFQAYNDMRAAEKDLRIQYRALLDHIFIVIYGKTDLTFTSKDLMRVGFDDSKEPKINENNFEV